MKITGYLVVSLALGLGVIAGCGDDGKTQPIDAPMADSPPPDPAMLAIDRTLHQFGSATLGQISPSTMFTITNTGDIATGTLTPSITGTDAAAFVQPVMGCVGRLQPGQSCKIEVAFAPSRAGTATATLSVTTTPGGSVSATLEGQGVALGALTVSTSISALGTVVVGQTSTLVSTFTVTNTGGTPSGVLGVQAAGSDPAEFTRSADGCTGVQLAAAASCTFSVRFTPLSVGAKAALFQISGTPGGTVSGAVTGVGIAPASLVVVPLQLDFGSVVVGQSSATLTATVTNIGGEPTGILAQVVSGADAAMFSALGTCNGTSLAAGTSCTVTVMFSPTSAGGHAALLSFTGSPGGSVATTLGGTGIAPGGLSITPSTHAFANTNVGQTATSQQYTVTNNTAAPTGPLSTTLGGSQVGEFQIIAGSDGCSGVSLASGAQCTISVTFQPTIGGVAHASLTVAGAPGGSVTAGLSGFGVSGAALTISPPSRAFGSVVMGQTSAPLTFTVTNAGGQVSGIPATALTGAGAAEFSIAGSTCTQTLAPGASCAIQVRFAPTSAGAVTATIGVTATPGGSVSATVSGDGIGDGLVIIPSSYAFPTTTIGDATSPQTLTVLNTGEAVTGTISLVLVGPNASEFSIASTTCTTLASNESCTVTVGFTPLGIGTRTATLVASATPGGTATAALSAVSRPRIEIIAINSGPVVDPYDFGVGTVSNTIPQDVLITVRNNTSSSKPFSITEAFGAPAQYATISTTCATTIGGSGGTCTVGVRFAPTSVGPKLGTITFSIGGGPFDAAAQRLTGAGAEGLTLTPLNGTGFGSVPLNTVSGTLRFRLTNAPGSVLTGPVTVTLTSGPFQLIADPCSGQALAAGASCLVDVRFVPAATGAVTATLTASATPGGAPSLVLTAAGVSPTGNPPTDIVLTPHAVAENSPSGATVGQLTTVDADVGDTFLYTLVPGAGSTDNGSFTLVGDIVHTVGTFDYETKSAYTIRVRSTDSGGQVFEKALTVDVINVDEPPVAVGDAATVLEDSGATAIDVLANDTDVDGGPKLVGSVTQPAHGSVVITGGGTGVTYAPAANYFGPDAFTYTLNGGSLATVAITVTPVDDAPVAVADAITVTEDSGATPIAVLANDTDVDGGPMQIVSVTPVAHGTLVITGGGTGVTYTPAANYNGPDGFTYTLNGGSTAMVTITVTPVDDPPVAVNDSASTLEDASPAYLNVIANDTDIDGGPLMVVSFTQGAHGTVAAFQTGVTYQPQPNFNGVDTFTYTLNGGSTATVTFTVIPVDDPPTAVNDTVTVVQGSSANTLAVLANDLDIDGGAISVASVTAASNGTVAISAGNGSVTYTPNAGYCNLPPGTTPDTFTYTLAPGTSTATVTVKVACLPTFTGPTDTTVGTSPHAVVTGDFNNDGNLDVAVANTVTGDVTILLGLGDTTFAAPAVVAVGAGPSALAVGYFDGDTNLDLVVANTTSNDVSILLGTGTGSFGAATSFAVGSGPSAVAVGDFNKDLHTDVAVANASANTVSILLGTGTGSFGAPSSVATGANPQGVAVADLDNDTNPDLVVANAGANTVGVHLGNGTGGFAAASSFAVGSLPSAVAIRDVNNDGRRDLVVANAGASSVSVLLRTSAGSFAAATSFAVGATPVALALGDFNRDGVVDIATANFDGDTVTILVGTGNGQFGGPATLPAGNGPVALAAGDLNNDLKLDLVVANSIANSVSVLAGN